MDAVFCRLQSIRQSIDHVSTLSAGQEQKILKRLLDVYNKLNKIRECNKDTLKTLWDDVITMLSEIESILFIPVVSHLITQLEVKGREVNYDNELRAQPKENVCKFQESRVKENFAKASLSEVCLDDKSTTGLNDDFWAKRKDRIHDLLGDTSLRFDKSCLKRKQKSLSWDPCIAETDAEHCNGGLKVSQLRCSSGKPQTGKNLQESIDAFWGLSEDHSWKDESKKWKAGEIICVLNGKSELNKLQEFLKDKKPVCSFYVQRKPLGIAGCKGTWLTPPYSPPLVVKYGRPHKPSSK